MIVESVEINRKPEDVFAYIEALDRHGEWQEQVLSVELLSNEPTQVGTRVVETRSISGREMKIAYEVTEHDPPRRTSFKGIDGPVRAEGTVSVESIDDGTRSRVTIELDFHGHGLGKLMAPAARKGAHKQVPLDQQRLKEKLEQGV